MGKGVKKWHPCFGGAENPSKPEDLNIQDAATRYDTESNMTCLLDYIKQFANTVKVYEGILSPEDVDVDFDTDFDWTV